MTDGPWSAYTPAQPTGPWDTYQGPSPAPTPTPAPKQDEGNGWGWLGNLGAGIVHGITSTPDAIMSVFDPGRSVTDAIISKGLAEDPRIVKEAQRRGVSPESLAGEEVSKSTSIAHPLNKLVGAATSFNPEDVKPGNAHERLLQNVGAGIGGAILPAGEGTTVASLLRNGLIGAGAGAGAGAAQEYAPEPLKPIAGLAAGLAAGVATHGAISGVEAGAKGAAPLIDPIIAGVSEAATKRQAAARIANKASDFPTVLDQLHEQGPELVPGSEPTLFQATNDIGLGALEREQAVKSPAPFIERANEQNAARLDSLRSLQSEADPMAVSTKLKGAFDAVDQQTSADVADAVMRAEDHVTATTTHSADHIAAATDAAHAAGMDIPDLTPANLGTAIRDAVGTAEQAASVRSRGLYEAIDPDGKLTANTKATSEGAQRILSEEPATAKPMVGEEAQVFQAAAQLPELAPARDLIALMQRVNAEMRAELTSAGKTPTYARLARLRGDIQNNVTNTISDRIVQENAQTLQGALNPDETIAARIQGWRDEYEAKRATASGESAGGFASQNPTGNAGSDGAGLPEAGGLGSSTGDQGVSPDTPTFDASARDRLNAANAAYRQKMATFGRGPMKDIIAKAGMSDVFRLPVESVAAKVWRKGVTGQADAEALMKAIGEGAANKLIGEAAATSLRRAAMGDDGVVNVAAYNRWKRDHAEALKALPDEMRGKFGVAANAAERLAQTSAERALADKRAASTAKQMITEAEGDRAIRMRAVQEGVVGKLLGAGTSQEVSDLIGGTFNRATAPSDMRKLMDRMEGDPDARAGFRQAVANYISKRFISATEGEPIKAATFQTFLRDKSAALKEVFTPTQLDGMSKIAADLKRSQMSQTGAKLKGGSNTAQDTYAMRVAQGLSAKRSMLELIAGAYGVHALGVLTGMLGTAGIIAAEVMRSAGLVRVDELVTRAMLDPKLAAELLKSVPKTKAAGMSLGRAIARSAIAAKLTTHDPVVTSGMSPPVVAADEFPTVNSPDRSKWDKRPDGSDKGDGWLGVRKRPDGGVSSEISVGVEINGHETEIPLMVPGLTPTELRYLMTHDVENPDFQKDMPPSIMEKAEGFAQSRLAQGKSPFRQPGESLSGQ